MADIVLVHGAWQGAWCWDRVVPGLRAAGHRISTPTLTGSGSRAALLSPAVDLATHLDDVEPVIRQATAPVVLVVHSYAGMIVPGVAARCGDRIGAVVLVDAFYPDEGQAAIDQMPPPFRQRFQERAAEVGDGWRLPADEGLLDVWGLHDPADRQWVGDQLTDWSLRCFESPNGSSRRVLADLPRWYVAGTAECPARAGFGPISRLAESDGCTLVEVPSGHDVMVEAPSMLVGVVVDVGGR